MQDATIKMLKVWLPTAWNVLALWLIIRIVLWKLWWICFFVIWLPVTYFYQKEERIIPATLRAVSVFPCPESLTFFRCVNVTEHLHVLWGGSMGRPRSYERCGWKWSESICHFRRRRFNLAPGKSRSQAPYICQHTHCCYHVTS